MQMISIIIPVYNVAAYIERCLQSIAKQTYTQYEIIIVDDGSTDNSYDKCLAFKDQYFQLDISIIRKLNEGVTAARRDGVKIAKGEWITFVDGDDTLPETALEFLISSVDTGVNIVIGAHNLEYDDGTSDFCPNKNIGRFNSISYISIFLLYNMEGAPWAKLFRRDILNDTIFDLPRDIKNKEDIIMNLRIAVLQRQDVIFIDKPVYNYLTNRPNSALTLYLNTFDLGYEIRILDYLASALKSGGLFIFFQKEIAIVYLMHIWGWKRKLRHASKEQMLNIKFFCDFVLLNNASIFSLFKVSIVYLLLLLKYLNIDIFSPQSLVRLKGKFF
ncbi:glycosyltransferase family 2 protein [Flavobacterium sp. LT1R49]|uniref:glycosyltransferase family 2 protein n=1 Tax=Flavobacterium arabinosi TaxID=3398737 RepID=UPI003A8C7543